MRMYFLTSKSQFPRIHFKFKCCLQDQGQYWYDASTPYKLVSPAQFSEFFKQSRIGQAEHERLTTPFDAKDQELDVRLSL